MIDLFNEWISVISYSLSITDEAIKAVLQERAPLAHLRPGLTAQDIFFSQVSFVRYIHGLK